MFTYIFLTILLFVLAYWEAVSRVRTVLPLSFATVILVIFVGMRFETGADWMEYESLLYMTSALFSDIPMYFNPNIIVEPGFSILMMTINTLSLSFQFLLFFCASFSIIVLSRFLWIYSKNPTLIMLWYCGFALLIGQMAAIRQVVAYAFVLLAFIAYDRKKIIFSIMWSIVAVSMHVFAIVLVPIAYIKINPPNTKLIISVCLFGLFASIFGVNIFAIMVAPVSLVMGHMVQAKLEIYNSSTAFQISPFAFLLCFWHGSAIALINRPQLPDWDKPVIRCAIYAAIWSLIAHTFLATLPAIWNRVMLFSMPLEMLALLQCYGRIMRQPVSRLAVSFGVWLVSAASIGYGLWGENALPYLPYRSIVQVWMTGNPGDGRMRYMIEQERLNRVAEEQRQP